MTSGTSGDSGGTGGATRAKLALPFALTVALMLVIGIVNALTVAADHPPPLDWWEPWLWELSSTLFWVAATLPIWWLVRAGRARLTWPALAALLLALTPLVTLLHAGWFALGRGAVYALAGSHYVFDWSWANLVYEWRKDVLSVTLLAAIGVGIDRLFAPPPLAPAAPPPWRLEVRDGSRTLWLDPHDISHAEAAGNYVELFTANGTILHRSTLSALERELVPRGFVRIHRSRLVRRDAIRAITTTAAGDFAVTLAGGATVPGSRRFRANLDS